MLVMCTLALGTAGLRASDGILPSYLLGVLCVLGWSLKIRRFLCLAIGVFPGDWVGIASPLTRGLSYTYAIYFDIRLSEMRIWMERDTMLLL